MPSVIRGSDLFDTNTAIGFSTNHNAATGTVTIPSGLEIGTRRLIRKIHPTQGTVTINCTGETFTRAGLASVTLNADGDYWLLEKVTATRWELVDGVESGENSDGEYWRKADGKQTCTGLNDLTQIIDISNGSGFRSADDSYSYPVPFSSSARVTDSAQSFTAWTNIRVAGMSGFTIRGFSFTEGSVTISFRYVAVGRWYE